MAQDVCERWFWHVLLLLGFGIGYLPMKVAAQNSPDPAATFISLATSTSISTAAATPLNVFQVSPPLLVPQGVVGAGGEDVGAGTTGAQAGGSKCEVLLMDFVFKDSFGKPFVGNYTPPSCAQGMNSVVMNFTVQSRGTQFDRLSVMYFGDTEVWRTSTAEPKRAGIVWTYMKDMSHLMYYWKTPQKVIFDLPNQTTANLTGTFNATLSAAFFSSKEAVPAANIIIPISNRQGINASSPSAFSIPTQNAANIITSFPRNANKAIFSLSSTGQGNEEFWWSNALQSAVQTYNATGGTLFGSSPFREVQLYIDNQLAGVQWPFPVIFTGGVVPAFWSPMVGIDAFDLKEYEIDVTPFLPLLCDGQPHTFSMNVVGLTDDGKTAQLSTGVNTSWVLSGKIFIWTDSSTTSITTGTAPSISASPPTISITQSLSQNSTGANDTLTYTVSVTRKMSTTATVKTENASFVASWTQTLSHADNGSFTNFGNTQANIISTTGRDVSIRGVETPYTYTYSYPLSALTIAVPQSNGTTRFTASLSRTKSLEISGQGIAPSGLQPFAILPESEDLVLTLAGTTLVASQNGTAILSLDAKNGNNSFSFGEMSGRTRFGGRSAQGVLGMEKDEELWIKEVRVSNGSVTAMMERLVGRSVDENAGNVSVGVVSDGGLGEVDVGRWIARGMGGFEG